MDINVKKPLFILEIANNHMGDLDHGLRLISEFGKVCKKYPFHFAFKLQYRDLDSFIHPSMKNRLDVHYIKRFQDTRLTKEDFNILVQEIKKQGFLAIATPFDEVSVNFIEEQNLDFIKIASCSFNDWSLLERVSSSNIPVIASTAAAHISDIDNVVSFFTHRERSLSLLHCVGIYPTPDEAMELNQITLLRDRYPECRVGFSTHENPDDTDNIKMAIAKGSCIFEKHIALATEKYKSNAYSASPDQLDKWLAAAQKALVLCGADDNSRKENPEEQKSIKALQRGVFAKKEIKAGEYLSSEDIYFAFPANENQFTANNYSKYTKFMAKNDISTDAAINIDNVSQNDQRKSIWDIAQRVKALLQDSGVVVHGRTQLEISHHYGLENFNSTGITMLTLINRDYCKKLIVVLPGQEHPEQYHLQKDETFHVLYGEIDLKLNGVNSKLLRGDVAIIEPEVRHAFTSVTGAVIEELSSTHFKNDSYYTDEQINQNKHRKTILSYWMD